MEGFAVLLVVVVVFIFVRALFTSNTTSDPEIPINTPQQKLQLRFRSMPLPGHPDVTRYALEARGPFPIERPAPVTLALSLIDTTERTPSGAAQILPVLCRLDNYQEEETLAFQDRIDLGRISVGSGLMDWTPLLSYFPETLVFPRSGQRRIRAIVRAFRTLDPPRIHLGLKASGAVIWEQELTVTQQFDEEGYLDLSEKSQRSLGHVVELGIAMSFSDGSLDDREGDVVKRWMTKHVNMLEGQRREDLRLHLNNACKQAYAAATAGRLQVGTIVNALVSDASPAMRLEALELCYEVLTADGKASDSELSMIARIGTQLEVNPEHVTALRDRHLPPVMLDAHHDGDNLKHLLGISPGWSSEQIRQHLRTLYNTWNSRAQTLADPARRAEAERMLDLIARAKKRFVDS